MGVLSMLISPNKKIKLVIRKIIATISILVIFCSCGRYEERNEDAVYFYKQRLSDKNNIGDYTEKDYVSNCQKLIKCIYAPESAEQYNSIYSNFQDIINENCINQLYNRGVQLSDDDFQNTIEFNTVRLGYPDDNDIKQYRIYMGIVVDSNGSTYKLNVELDISGVNYKIDNIDVW